MKNLLKWFTPGLAAVLLMYASQSAAALLTPSIAVYTFKANCYDCAQVDQAPDPFLVSATLTLTSYVPGTALGGGGSVLFQYSGSNLFNAFQISSDTEGFQLSGVDTFPSVIGASGVPLNFAIRGDVANFHDINDPDPLGLGTYSIYFRSTKVDGNWDLGFEGVCTLEGQTGCAPADYGTAHTYSLASFTPAVNSNPVPNPVPEPGTLLLLGAALVAAGVARRRV